MKRNDILFLSIMGILITCALIFTVFLVKNRMLVSKSPLPKSKKNHNNSGDRYINNWKYLNVTGARQGPANAPVKIVEFFDYQCPFCMRSEPAVKTVLRKYSVSVSIIYENLPLQIHPQAFAAAIAAECVRRQAPNAFLAYHDSLLSQQHWLAALSYMKLAKHVGIMDTAAFHNCTEQQETAPVIKAAKQLADKLDIHGIPTFIVNDMLVTGALSKQQLDHLVQQALAKAEP